MLCFRKFLSEHLSQNTCFRTPVSKQMFQSTCFWTPVSEQLFQNICYRTNVSELIFQNIFEPIVVFFSKYLRKYEKIMFPWPNMKTSFVFKAKFSIKTRKLRSISNKISKIEGKKSRWDIPGLILKSRDFFTIIIPGFFIPSLYTLSHTYHHNSSWTIRQARNYLCTLRIVQPLPCWHSCCHA